MKTSEKLKKRLKEEFNIDSLEPDELPKRTMSGHLQRAYGANVWVYLTDKGVVGSPYTMKECVLAKKLILDRHVETQVFVDEKEGYYEK